MQYGYSKQREIIGGDAAARALRITTPDGVALSGMWYVQ
eukprot:gene12434-18501_t